jgi:hypothetical protein
MADTAQELRDNIRPVKPRRKIEEMLDDIIFSPECVEAYRRRYAASLKGPRVSKRLRDEIRCRGFLDGYFTVAVPGRFEFDIGSEPSPDNPVTVRSLRFPNRRAER